VKAHAAMRHHPEAHDHASSGFRIGRVRREDLERCGDDLVGGGPQRGMAFEGLVGLAHHEVVEREVAEGEDGIGFHEGVGCPCPLQRGGETVKAARAEGCLEGRAVGEVVEEGAMGDAERAGDGAHAEIFARLEGLQSGLQRGFREMAVVVVFTRRGGGC
jgi:hypothetical protein